MILLHSSDLHGHYDPLLDALRSHDYDVWVDTGDLHKNKIKDRHQNQPIGSVAIERGYQRRIVEDYVKLDREIALALAGRPAVLQPGNHCYYDLGKALRRRGVTVFRPKPYDAFKLLGHTWSGFRDIPWINGDWNFECKDLAHLIQAALSHEPDILVTHANPLMPGDKGYGSQALADMIFAAERPPRLHLFGHSHRTGGEMWLRGGTLHVNGACNVKLLEV